MSLCYYSQCVATVHFCFITKEVCIKITEKWHKRHLHQFARFISLLMFDYATAFLPCPFLQSPTFNRWRTVVSGTWKYDDPRLNMSHEGTARVWHVQPRVVLFPCPTNDCVSYVLSSDQLNIQVRGFIIGVSKTLCDFGHEILQKYKLVNYRHIPTFCNLVRVPCCRQN